MRISKSIIFGTLALGAILDAQNITSQYVLYASDQSLPYFEAAQFATPDSSGGLFFFNATDGSLHRFDSAGHQLWSASFSFGALQGVISTMAVAADGVYLGGQVNGALPGQTNAGSYDAFVVKYDLNGKSLWTQEFGTADGDSVRTIALVPDGFYVLGVSSGSTRLFIPLESERHGNLDSPLQRSCRNRYPGGGDRLHRCFLLWNGRLWRDRRRWLQPRSEIRIHGNDLWTHNWTGLSSSQASQRTTKELMSSFSPMA